MNECIFCQITHKKIPAKIHFEDENFIAFDDIDPKAKIHILIIPKTHYGSILTLNQKDFNMVGNLIKTAQKVAKNMGLKSFRLTFNSGKDAGMMIDHLHLHLLGGEKSKHFY